MQLWCRLFKRTLFPRPVGPTPGGLRFVAPDSAAIHSQLKRKGLTLQLLWEEYRAIHGAQSYSYSQYCSLYRDFRGSLQRSMRGPISVWKYLYCAATQEGCVGKLT